MKQRLNPKVFEKAIALLPSPDISIDISGCCRAIHMAAIKLAPDLKGCHVDFFHMVMRDDKLHDGTSYWMTKCIPDWLNRRLVRESECLTRRRWLVYQSRIAALQLCALLAEEMEYMPESMSEWPHIPQATLDYIGGITIPVAVLLGSINMFLYLVLIFQ